jgi:hypothetical protein
MNIHPNQSLSAECQLYEAILKLAERGQMAGPVTLKNYFEKDGDLEHVGLAARHIWPIWPPASSRSSMPRITAARSMTCIGAAN